jgi:hypothetical protein
MSSEQHREKDNINTAGNSTLASIDNINSINQTKETPESTLESSSAVAILSIDDNEASLRNAEMETITAFTTDTSNIKNDAIDDDVIDDDDCGNQEQQMDSESVNTNHAETTTATATTQSSSLSSRAEYYITAIDKAIQAFLDLAALEHNNDNNDPDGNEDTPQQKYLLKVLVQKLVSRLFPLEYGIHSSQRINTFFLIFFTVTVLPFTRFIILYTIEKIIYLLLTIVGTTIGIAIGFIIAMHAYQIFYLDKDQSQDNDQGDNTDDPAPDIASTATVTAQMRHLSNNATFYANSDANAISQISHISHVPAHLHASSNPYAALMASAGYAVTNTTLPHDVNSQISNSQTSSSNANANTNNCSMRFRAQILRNIPSAIQHSFLFHKDPAKRNSIYQSPSIDNAHALYKSKGLAMFQRMWPNLPTDVQTELGTLVDFIARDYIISWYHLVDDGVGYENEIDKRKRLINEKGSDGGGNNGNDHNDLQSQPQPQPSSNPGSYDSTATAMMILSTTPTRTIPFLEIFYTSLTTVLGNLTTTCEKINVPHLVLVKFMNILKSNVRTYKDMRKVVLQKRSKKRRMMKDKSKQLEDGGSEEEEESSMEIAIIREYLQKGKFHRAITFGMDVPGLLFGDANGR